MGNYPPLHPGSADFPRIRRQQGLYIDKTVCFRDLLSTVRPPVPGDVPGLVNTHQFLVRPRRFGKTLLINTLETWFQGLPPGHAANPDGDTAQLVGMPAGWTSPPWLWAGLDAEDWHGTHGWHPVIRLDLSRVATPDPAGTRTALQAYLWDVIGEWYDRGLNWPPGVPGAAPPESPSDLLVALIRTLKNTHGRQPVVLVDEYDAPITEHLGTDVDPMPAVDELRRFFRVLKDDEGRLYGVFVTGITRLAKPHLFSAANNFTDISDDPAMSALCGFTEAEVERNLWDYRQALRELESGMGSGFDEASVLDAWRDMYNGYRFALNADAARIYNPYTLIHGLERTLRVPAVRALAAEGQWPSAWSETAHAALAVRLAADTHQSLPPGVRAGGTPQPARGLDSLRRPDFARLMQDAGYYTWHGGGDGATPYLDFPNREVTESWLRDIMDLWDARDRPGAADLLDDVRDRLHAGDVDGFARSLETFYSGLAHHNLDSEACYRAVLQTLCRLVADLVADDVQAEKSTWGGRADLEVAVGTHIYVMEVKHGRSAASALRQIGDRPYGREHLGTDRTVTAVGLAFRKDDRNGVHLECEHQSLRALLQERDSDTRDDRPPPGHW